MDICLAFRWRLLHWRAAFGFRGEKVLVSVFEVRSLTYPPLSSVSVCLCFPSVFLSLSLPRMPLLAGGFVCFMPQREPSCTDVLPGLQFLAFAWSSRPSRTTGPDEELWKLHLAASHSAASHSTWGFCPQTSPPLPPPPSSWVLLWNKGSCQEGESIIALAQGATFNVSAQMEKRAQHNKSEVK